MSKQEPLRVRQFEVSLIAPQFGLLQLATVRTPAKDRDLQCRHRGITQIADSIGSNRKLVGIDSIKIVDAESRQQTSPGSCYFVVCSLISCHGRPEVWIVLLSCGFDFGKRR